MITWFIVFIWLFIGLFFSAWGIYIFNQDSRRRFQMLLVKAEEAENELYRDLAQTNVNELAQTTSGRELLKTLYGLDINSVSENDKETIVSNQLSISQRGKFKEAPQLAAKSHNFVKRFFDLVIAIIVLILSLPWLLIIALIIKLDSPGPILSRNRVIGKNKREFDCFKFRTIYVDAEEYPSHKLNADSPVTRIGRFLRKSSLDEMPQLINVLAGDMSLVGPRPISPKTIENYGEDTDDLFTFAPGITGLWLITDRSSTSSQEKISLDLQYIKNYSIWSDIVILLETIPALLKGKGAH